MPLLDHFHPPLSKRRHRTNLHSAWSNALRDQLNDGLLPPNYVAEVKVTIGNRAEVDVGSLREGEGTHEPGSVLLWAPPRPQQQAVLNFTSSEVFEVQVFQEEEGPKLVAAIELISPANKDRASERHMFAVKCASYLQDGVGVVIVDVVTHGSANLHAELFRLLQVPVPEADLPALYAAAYRTVAAGESVKLEYWLDQVSVAAAPPVMPLWIAADICLPVELEKAYVAACRSSRIAV